MNETLAQNFTCLATDNNNNSLNANLWTQGTDLLFGLFVWYAACVAFVLAQQFATKLHEYLICPTKPKLPGTGPTTLLPDLPPPVTITTLLHRIFTCLDNAEYGRQTPLETRMNLHADIFKTYSHPKKNELLQTLLELEARRVDRSNESTYKVRTQMLQLLFHLARPRYTLLRHTWRNEIRAALPDCPSCRGYLQRLDDDHTTAIMLAPQTAWNSPCTNHKQLTDEQASQVIKATGTYVAAAHAVRKEHPLHNLLFHEVTDSERNRGQITHIDAQNIATVVFYNDEPNRRHAVSNICRFYTIKTSTGSNQALRKIAKASNTKLKLKRARTLEIDKERARKERPTMQTRSKTFPT